VEAARRRAQQAGVTLNTARTQVKRIFVKAEVSRQADLVRLVLSATSHLPNEPWAGL
jgi:DNA-binding CsgD family transcriptional regulator